MTRTFLLLVFLLAFTCLLPPVGAEEDKAENILWPAKIDGSFGYIDSTGSVVIKPKCDFADFFFEGVAWVEKDGKPSVINSDGKNLFTVSSGKYALRDSYSNGMTRIRLGELTGYMDIEGRVAITPKYFTAGKFHEDMAWVKSSGASNFFYIDTKGQRAIKGDFCMANDFSEGLAAVMKDRSGKYGYIDAKGKFAIDPMFEGAEDFSQGLAAVKIGGKWGYIDKAADIIIPVNFDRAGRFKDGLAPVQQGEFWGYIDKTGEMVISPHYAMAYEFSNGIAAVCLRDKYGAINTKGGIVVGAKYDSLVLSYGAVYVPGTGYYNGEGKLFWREGY